MISESKVKHEVYKRGMTLKSVAGKMNVDPARLSEWIKNRHDPRLSHAVQLAESIGCDLGDILV